MDYGILPAFCHVNPSLLGIRVQSLDTETLNPMENGTAFRVPDGRAMSYRAQCPEPKRHMN